MMITGSNRLALLILGAKKQNSWLLEPWQLVLNV